MNTYLSVWRTASLITFVCLTTVLVSGQTSQSSETEVSDVRDVDEAVEILVDTNPCLDGCRFDNSLGFVADPFDCSQFYQCGLGGSGIISTVQKPCPPGLFWSQQQVTCVRPSKVECEADKCRSSPDGFYLVESNCNVYWACSGQKSKEMRCCSPGTSFNLVTRQCEPSTCSDLCPLRQDRTNNDFIRVVCDKYTQGSNLNVYFQQIAGYPFAIQQKCPSGLGFNNFTCNCDIKIKTPAVQKTCTPEVYLPLDADFRDRSGKGTFISREGASIARFNQAPPGTIGDGCAFFDGSSHIKIPRYTNAYLGKSLKISFRYLPVNIQFNSNRMEALVSNSGCDTPATVAIAFDRSEKGTFCSIDTKGKGNQGNLLPASIPTDNWRNVSYVYDGRKLRLEVNSDIDIAPAFGVISTSKAALKIGGQCDRMNGFTGYIDEVRIFKCLED